MPDAVTAVVLAAGASSRFSAGAKQLARIGGESAVRRAVRAAAESACDETVVVTGHEAVAITAELADLAVRTTHNPDYAGGQSSSVRAGLRAVAPTSAAALFLPCDQPFLDAATITRVVEAWRCRGGIAVAASRGRRGSPVLFPRRLFAELAAISGDEGARQLLARHAGDVLEVELPDPAPLEDFDTVERLKALLAGREIGP